MATVTKGKTFINGELVTPAALHQLVDSATVTGIANADIAANAAIADTKLAQISTAGKVLPAAVQGTAVITTDSRLSDARTPTSHTHDDRYYTETEMNTLLAGKQASGSYAPASGIAPSAITGTAVITTDSRLSDARTPTSHTHSAADITSGTLANARTTATNANTVNAIVARDASGNFSAGTITANLTGTASGNAPASGIAPSAITGTAVITTDSRLSDARTPTSHTHSAADITSGTLANARTTATNANTVNAIVARDASGNFSAGTITASLTGTASGNAPATGIAPSAITGTAVITTDSRLSDARTPTAHTHGNITNAGAIGTTSGVPLITGTSGVLQAGSFGTAAGTYCQGNDSRLSDARTPTSHNHDASAINAGTLANARTTATNANTVNAIVARDASGNFNTSSINNISVSRGSGNLVDNLQIGLNSLKDNTTGIYNLGIGHYTLKENTIGVSNTALGWAALEHNIEGSDNTAIGDQALHNNKANGNTAVGRNSLLTNIDGILNTAVGYNALQNNLANGNTAVGYESGATNQTGSNNTFIGRGATGPSTATSNTITLGNSAITSLRCQVTTITSLSDARDKKDIQPLPAGLDFISRLRPVSFVWDTRDKAKVNIPDTGFIAQELLATQEATGITIPNLVSQENPDKLEAGYGTLIPVLVKAVQELAARVAALEAK